MKPSYNSVDEYIQTFPSEIQITLENIRSLIKTNAPQAVESFSYGMPAYKLHNKPLVYFAAFKSHIGFYALPTGHSEFAAELAHYKHGKGSMQFPLNRPVPYELIARIVRFRAAENLTRK